VMELFVNTGKIKYFTEREFSGFFL